MAAQEADTAARKAKAAAHEAEVAAQEARRRGEAERWERYRSNIAAASAALHEQNSGAARVALEAAPEEHRNWEWQHFHSQLDGARLVLPVPGGRVRCLVLSPSGRQIAVSCPTITRFTCTTWPPAGSRPSSAVTRLRSTSVAYRPDGKQVATGSNDQTIRLWDPATGRESAFLKRSIPTEPRWRPHRGVQLGRQPDCFLMPIEHCSRHEPVVGRDHRQGIAVLGKWQEGTPCVAFSPDGKRVAVSSREYVHLCDAGTGRQLAVSGPSCGAQSRLAYSPDGQADCVRDIDGTPTPFTSGTARAAKKSPCCAATRPES